MFNLEVYIAENQGRTPNHCFLPGEFGKEGIDRSNTWILMDNSIC